jgi:HAD superfamily hydrolase (TIGR01484 family)
MYFFALATDYDGTLALGGAVDDATLRCLEKLRESGRRLVMVTGRRLEDLIAVFPHVELFDLLVVENGAVLFDPAERSEELLCEPADPRLVAALQAERVEPLSVGRAIVATWQPNEHRVLQAIRDLGLELKIVFNKGAVMVLPGNVNKATGLAAALTRLKLSPHNVVGVGDAENDHAFLMASGCAAAVQNALPAVKETADLVTRGDHGSGVCELIDAIIADDLAQSAVGRRHRVPLGRVVGEDRDAYLDPRGGATLITGISGGGKSTLTTAFLERAAEAGFQFLVVDPEGDYVEFGHAIVLGNRDQAPRREEISQLLSEGASIVANLLAIDVEERRGYFGALLPDLHRMRIEIGRPHWLVLDEAHHLLPTHWQPAEATVPRDLPATILVTTHPKGLARPLLATVTTVVVVGRSPQAMIDEFAALTGLAAPVLPETSLAEDEVFVYRPGNGMDRVRFDPPKHKLKRHARKYAEGELGEEKSFYFRGPESALNLRARNLSMFLQLARGVDERTWLHHLQRGDYSRWFRDAIKDEELADAAAELETQAGSGAQATRERMEALITERYAVSETG